MYTAQIIATTQDPFGNNSVEFHILKDGEMVDDFTMNFAAQIDNDGIVASIQSFINSYDPNKQLNNPQDLVGQRVGGG